MAATKHKVEVGARFRQAIEAIGLSQSEVARFLDVSPSKLGNWLRGDNYPDEFVLVRFCDRYNITTDYILRGRVSAAMDRALADALFGQRAEPEA